MKNNPKNPPFCKIYFIKKSGFRSLFLTAFLSLFALSFSFGNNLHSFGIINAQPKEISGTISEENGQALMGATIVVKGTTIGTVSDLNGMFKLAVPPDAVSIVVSFVGMISKEITLGDQRIFNITLLPEVLGIDEVVVVGYGVQKKESVVGSIINTTRETLERRGGVSNLGAALSGQLPGVTVLERTGEPGREDPVIYIRGLSTWNEGQPLLLVDGIERRMNDIDISEVESVSVLKDASATAVFGVKGANGVILITTRRGKVGKAQLSASANYGIKNISKIYSVLDSYEQYQWINKGVENFVAVDPTIWEYYTPSDLLEYYKKPQTAPYKYIFPNVNWPDELLKNFATNHRFNLNVSGGTAFVRYFGSLAYSHESDIFKTPYNKEKGYQPGFGYDRFNFRGNLDFSLTKSTELSVNLHGFTGVRKETRLVANYLLFDALHFQEPSTFPVRHEDGIYGISASQINIFNPYALINESGTNNSNRSQLSTDIKLTQKLDFITKGLSVSANMSFDNYVISSGPNINDGGSGQILYKSINPSILYAQTAADSATAIQYLTSGGVATQKNEFDWQPVPIQYIVENVTGNELSRALFYQLSVAYNRQFSNHDISLLALMNRRENTTGATFPSYREDWVGRITYDYEKKYFLEVNAAYNGSEKFGPGYRFGFFPSLALGWMLSNEKFLSYDWLSEFKVRASLGKVGSDAGIPRWGYLDSWIYQGPTVKKGAGATWFGFPIGVRSPYTHYYEGTIANPSLRWETTIKQNIGIDIGVFSNQLRASFDYFTDFRKDIFISASQRSIPRTFGADPVPANLGETKTKGFELELSYKKRWENSFLIWINGNATRARDKITKFEDPELMENHLKNTGFAIGQTRTTMREGFLTNWDEIYASAGWDIDENKFIGDWGIIDFNGDGIIDGFDSAPYGFPSGRPQNTYSTTFGMGYKNLNFMVQFYGVTNISNNIFLKVPRPDSKGIVEFLNDYWTPDNPDAFYKAPRYASATSKYSATGDIGLYDGSFLRLKTIEISYDLPEKITKALTIASSRIFINGNNIFFWSKLPVDIERGGKSSGDNLGYPTFRQFNLGINVNF